MLFSCYLFGTGIQLFGKRCHDPLQWARRGSSRFDPTSLINKQDLLISFEIYPLSSSRKGQLPKCAPWWPLCMWWPLQLAGPQALLELSGPISLLRPIPLLSPLHRWLLPPLNLPATSCTIWPSPADRDRLVYLSYPPPRVQELGHCGLLHNPWHNSWLKKKEKKSDFLYFSKTGSHYVF